jgi:transposase
MSEAKSKRRVFTEEFKQDAVRLVSSEGYTFRAAASAVGVSEQTLRHWHARLTPKPPPCGEDATLDELREENKRLRRELRRAELEREILKKATAYFAKESQ